MKKIKLVLIFAMILISLSSVNALVCRINPDALPASAVPSSITFTQIGQADAAGNTVVSYTTDEGTRYFIKDSSGNLRSISVDQVLSAQDAQQVLSFVRTNQPPPGDALASQTSPAASASSGAATVTVQVPAVGSTITDTTGLTRVTETEQSVLYRDAQGNIISVNKATNQVTNVRLSAAALATTQPLAAAQPTEPVTSPLAIAPISESELNVIRASGEVGDFYDTIQIGSTRIEITGIDYDTGRVTLTDGRVMYLSRDAAGKPRLVQEKPEYIPTTQPVIPAPLPPPTGPAPPELLPQQPTVAATGVTSVTDVQGGTLVNYNNQEYFFNEGTGKWVSRTTGQQVTDTTTLANLNNAITLFTAPAISNTLTISGVTYTRSADGVWRTADGTQVTGINTIDELNRQAGVIDVTRIRAISPIGFQAIDIVPGQSLSQNADLLQAVRIAFGTENNPYLNADGTVNIAKLTADARAAGFSTTGFLQNNMQAPIAYNNRLYQYDDHTNTYYRLENGRLSATPVGSVSVRSALQGIQQGYLVGQEYVIPGTCENLNDPSTCGRGTWTGTHFTSDERIGPYSVAASFNADGTARYSFGRVSFAWAERTSNFLSSLQRFFTGRWQTLASLFYEENDTRDFINRQDSEFARAFFGGPQQAASEFCFQDVSESDNTGSVYSPLAGGASVIVGGEVNTVNTPSGPLYLYKLSWDANPGTACSFKFMPVIKDPEKNIYNIDWDTSLHGRDRRAGENNLLFIQSSKKYSRICIKLNQVSPGDCLGDLENNNLVCNLINESAQRAQVYYDNLPPTVHAVQPGQPSVTGTPTPQAPTIINID